MKKSTRIVITIAYLLIAGFIFVMNGYVARIPVGVISVGGEYLKPEYYWVDVSLSPVFYMLEFVFIIFSLIAVFIKRFGKTLRLICGICLLIFIAIYVFNELSPPVMLN